MIKKDKIVYTDYIEPVVFRDKAIDINTKRGKRAATKMAHRITEGKERIENVPSSYRNYVNGVLYGSMPTSKAIDKAGRKFAPVIAGAAAAPWLISGGIAAYTNPVTKAIIDGIGTVDGIRNAASKNGVRKTIRLAKEKDYWGAAKSGIGDVFDIAGGLGFVDDAYRYTKGAGKRLAEVVFRMGPAIHMNPSKHIKNQFLNKDALNYILNPYANPNLAYNLPLKYSGNFADISGDVVQPFKGDVIDKFLRKVPVSSNFSHTEVPIELQKYILKNYPNKDIKFIDLGEVYSPITIPEYIHTLKDGDFIKAPGSHSRGGLATTNWDKYLPKDKYLLDPGGYNKYYSRKGNDLIEHGYDIWKFNADDYIKRYLPDLSVEELKKLSLSERIKRNVKRKIYHTGLKFIDEQGVPIIHRWHSTFKDIY